MVKNRIEGSEEERLQQLVEQGLLKISIRGWIQHKKLITLTGKSLSKIVSEEREEEL